LFFFDELSEGLRQLRVAIVLARVGVGEEFLRGGKLAGELGAVALIRSPGSNRNDGQEQYGGKSSKLNCELCGHGMDSLKTSP